LTGHLLHDHLGLQGAPEEHDAAIVDAAMADAIVSVPEPDSEHNMKMRGEEQRSDSRSKRQSIPLGESEKRNHEGSPIAEDKMPNHVVDGSEKCQWHGCELAFSTIDDLMNHLTAEHVGSGKNHYECFWGDCERSGKNGFTSKQKVCRHLQVRVHGGYPFRLPHDRRIIDAYRPQAVPMQALQTAFLRIGDAATAHASSHTRK
jgi:hypothetical protein